MKRYERGSSLIEGLIALLIFSFGMLGLAAYQVNALKNQTAMQTRVQAVQLANELVSVATADPASIPCYLSTGAHCSQPAAAAYVAQWRQRVSDSLPNTLLRPPVVELAPGDRLTVALYWGRDAKDQSELHQYVVTTHTAPGG